MEELDHGSSVTLGYEYGEYLYIGMLTLSPEKWWTLVLANMPIQWLATCLLQSKSLARTVVFQL